jgi:citrate lyase beta subunit
VFFRGILPGSGSIASEPLAAADLDAVAEFAYGIRIPKVESVEELRWVAQRAPGKPLICAIESARGVAKALEIASEPGVKHLALGGIDLQRDLGTSSGDAPLQYVRSHLVVASRARESNPRSTVCIRTFKTPKVFDDRPRPVGP